MGDVLNRWDGRDWLVALGLFLGALGVALLLQRPFTVLPGPDAISYVGGAESLLKTGEYRDPVIGNIIEHPPPLTSFLILGAFRLLGHSFTAAKAAMAFLAGLAVALTFLLGRLYHPRPIAALAAGLVATTPMFVESALNVNSDVVGMVLMTAALIALIIATLERSIPAAAIAGAFLGLGALSRTVFPPLIVLATVYLFIRTRTWKLAVPFFLAALLVLLPWQVHLASLTGNPLYNPSAVGNVPVTATGGPVNDAYEQTAYAYNEGGLKKVSFNPLSFVRKVITHLALIGAYYLPTMAGGLLILLFAFLELALNGAFFLRYQDWFLVVLGYFIAGLAATYPLARYFLAVLPLLAVLAAAGFARILRIVTPRVSKGVRRAVMGVAVGLLLLGGISQTIPLLAGPNALAANQAFEYVRVGAWLQEHTPADSTLLGRDGRIAYYAERRFALLPPASLAETLAFAQERNITYIVYDERAGHDRRPQLRMLADSEPLDGLRLVHAETGGKLDVYVWEVVPV